MKKRLLTDLDKAELRDCAECKVSYTVDQGLTDKQKETARKNIGLDDISKLADIPSPSNAMPQTIGTAPGGSGTSKDYARADHTHQIDVSKIEGLPGPSNITPPQVNTFAGSVGESEDYARADHTHKVDLSSKLNVPPYVRVPGTGLISDIGLLKGWSGSQNLEFAVPNQDYIVGEDFAILRYGVENSDANGVYPADCSYKVRRSKNLVAYWEHERRIHCLKGGAWTAAPASLIEVNGEPGCSAASITTTQAAQVAFVAPERLESYIPLYNTLEVLLYIDGTKTSTADGNVVFEFFQSTNSSKRIAWNLGTEVASKAAGWYTFILPLAKASTDTCDGDYSLLDTGRFFVYPKTTTSIKIAVGAITIIDEPTGTPITVTPAKKIIYNGDESTARYYAENETITLNPAPAGKTGYKFMGWKEVDV